MRWPAAPGGAGAASEQGELVEEVGVGLAQVEGDRARRVVGDDPRRQVAPPRVPVARWRAEDALVIDGDIAEAELALDAAAEVGRPHERAVGVPDSPAKRERVRRAAVGRPRQRNGQVRHERVPLRAACFAERDQSVVDGGERSRCECRNHAPGQAEAGRHSPRSACRRGDWPPRMGAPPPIRRTRPPRSPAASFPPRRHG